MDKILNFIGLAKRAGKISTGEFICRKAIQQGLARLVLVAEDASDNTKKAMCNSCKHYHVPYLEFADKDRLGKYTGGGSKAVVSVNDENFAKAVIEKIQGAAERKDR